MLNRADKPLRWLAGTLSTPPIGREAKSREMPERIVDLCQKRLEKYERG